MHNLAIGFRQCSSALMMDGGVSIGMVCKFNLYTKKLPYITKAIDSDYGTYIKLKTIILDKFSHVS